MTPSSTIERDRQRLDALARANAVRQGKAALKRDLKAGRVKLARIVLDPPEYALRATLYELVLAQHKVGRIKAHRIINRIGVSTHKTLAELTERQRVQLVNLLTRGGRR